MKGQRGEFKCVRDCANTLTREGLADAVAHTLEDRDVLLRIQNMNLYDIELYNRIEKLTVMLTEILRRFTKEIQESTIEPFCLTFPSFLFGVYSFVFHMEMQLEAMRIAGVEQSIRLRRSHQSGGQ